MINSILIDGEKSDLTSLEEKIIRYCPEVLISGKAPSISVARTLIREKNPDLLFIDINIPDEDCLDLLRKLSTFDCEFIIVTEIKSFAIEAIKYCASGYILKPVGKEDLVLAVRNVREKIKIKEKMKRNQKLMDKLLNKSSNSDLIGIPTLEGFDFIPVQKIMRCEGLQKCTRIITVDRSNIISSYNLGEFRKLLEPNGFFSPHKSHLINLCFVKKYQRAGNIIMVDDSRVPVSRRKKSKFLELIPHL